VAGAPAAFVRIHFDWTAGDRRLRSDYLVYYRWRDGRIVRQEIHYDPRRPARGPGGLSGGARSAGWIGTVAMAERTDASTATPQPGPDFIRQIVADDNRTGKHGGRVVTRFPPEPNGYLHIGHAKSIGIDYGIARENDGVFHLRFDDTNPAKEEVEYVDSIMRDVRWLGADWGDKLFYASDYFEQLYQWAEQLIEDGLAVRRRVDGGPDPRDARDVDRARAEQPLPRPAGGREPGPLPANARRASSPTASSSCARRSTWRRRTSTCATRSSIASATRSITGPASTWCIYPMYDYAHPLSDAIEKITHSICTLEFEDHRPAVRLADRAREHGREPAADRVRARQPELHRHEQAEAPDARAAGATSPAGTIPACPRSRPYAAAACRRRRSVRSGSAWGSPSGTAPIDVAMLEHAIRTDLNRTAPRVMAVTRPLKLVIENFPADRVEELQAVNNPEDPAMGTRTVPFSRELYIEQDDFREVPPPKYFRLSPGTEVRLRWAYLVRCTSVVKDASGAVVEVRCTYDPESRGGNPADGRKVKSTIHWVSAAHAIPAELRLYDRLFDVEDPSGDDWLAHLNPHSLEIVRDAKLEPSLTSGRARQPLAVRAHRLLLRRRGLEARRARVQSHGHAARHLGEDRIARRRVDRAGRTAAALGRACASRVPPLCERTTRADARSDTWAPCAAWGALAPTLDVRIARHASRLVVILSTSNP
jgi:glutaminyl-tRNA synthetase